MRRVIEDVQAFELRENLRKRVRRDVDQSRFELTISAVICDLAHVVLTKDPRGLAVPRSNKVLGAKNRYGADALNQQLPSILDALSDPSVDWVEQVIGFRNPFQTIVPTAHHQRSLVRPSKKLIDAIEAAGITLGDLCIGTMRESIILKSGRDDFWSTSKRTHYDDATTVAPLLRAEMTTINQALAAAEIDFDESVLEKPKSIDMGNRSLRRTFTNGLFDNGGRLFGGFWMELKAQDRLDGLWIDGEPVASLDYRQMGLRILYGIAGASLPLGDLYWIKGISDLPGGPYREGIKKLVNSMMFMKGEMKRKPKGLSDLLPFRPIGLLTQHIREAHPAISHRFGTAVGHEVQFHESCILVDAMLRMIDRGIVGLPIHDCFVVKRSAVSEAKAIMLSAFRDRMGLDGEVEIEASERETPGDEEVDTAPLPKTLTIAEQIEEQERLEELLISSKAGDEKVIPEPTPVQRVPQPLSIAQQIELAEKLEEEAMAKARADRSDELHDDEDDAKPEWEPVSDKYDDHISLQPTYYTAPHAQQYGDAIGQGMGEWVDDNDYIDPDDKEGDRLDRIDMSYGDDYHY